MKIQLGKLNIFFGKEIENKAPKREVLKQKIVERQLYRFNADIGRWREALEAAESIYTPQRADLMRVFQEVIIDAHLTSVWNNRVAKVLSLDYDLINANGEVADQSQILKTDWFIKTLKYFMEAILYGYTLIEFDDIEDFKFKHLHKIPREYIEPSKKILKKEWFLTDGIPFTEEPFNNWAFYVEYEDNLGLLNKAAPHTIWKKNAMGSWGEYADMFGVPPRIGRTNVRDDKLRKNMEDMLSNMGRLSYGVFDVDDTIELVEGQTGDAFNVFMQLVDVCNSEISKLIIGQTMTTEDGSSRSQSEVHERTFDNIARQDTRWLESIINKQFLPWLIEEHNFPFEGLKFKFDLTEGLDIEKQMEMIKVLINHKNIPSDFIQERFGIPVEDIIKEVEADNEVNSVSKITYYNDYYTPVHVCEHLEVLNQKKIKYVLTQAEEEALYKHIYDGLINTNNLPENLYAGTVNELREAMYEGFKSTPKDLKPNSFKYNLLQDLDKDIHKLSAAKTFQNIGEMQRLLRDADGVFKTFGEFKKEAKQIYDTFNVHYLRTEFNTAFASSQAAENWADLQDRKDVFPNVRYRTVGDDNVRPEHQALDGNVYALDSSDLSVVYPPNDWNCRCYVESTTSPVKNSVTNNLSQLNPDFAFNAGKDRILFPPKHPYYNVPKSFAAKKKRNFDLPTDI